MMRYKSVKALERLSNICQLCGLVTVMLGIVTGFVDVINVDYSHVQVGIFIFSTGYAFIKISAKISLIIFEEKQNE